MRQLVASGFRFEADPLPDGILASVADEQLGIDDVRSWVRWRSGSDAPTQGQVITAFAALVGNILVARSARDTELSSTERRELDRRTARLLDRIDTPNQPPEPLATWVRDDVLTRIYLRRIRAGPSAMQASLTSEDLAAVSDEEVAAEYRANPSLRRRLRTAHVREYRVPGAVLADGVPPTASQLRSAAVGSGDHASVGTRVIEARAGDPLDPATAFDEEALRQLATEVDQFGPFTFDHGVTWRVMEPLFLEWDDLELREVSDSIRRRLARRRRGSAGVELLRTASDRSPIRIDPETMRALLADASNDQ